MPWNKGTKAFAYLGGTFRLLFVWVGLVNFTPRICLAGRLYSLRIFSCVQTQHRSPAKLPAVYISPNQDVTKGELIYEIDDTKYVIARDKASVQLESAHVALDTARQRSQNAALLLGLRYILEGHGNEQKTSLNLKILQHEDAGALNMT